MRSSLRWVGILLCMVLLCSTADAARRARKASSKGVSKASVPKVRVQPVQPVRPAESFICIEAGSGIVLAEQNADEVRPPASMVKMMLMLLVSEGLEKNQWTLEKPIVISQAVQATDESQVFLTAGEQFSLGELMSAVAVCSANDAALAVAEGLWGSKAAYVKAMNARAQELGMKDSVFQTPHGLPPAPGELPDQTTARDMAILARECVRHPSLMLWVGQQELKFRAGAGIRSNTNKLLWSVQGCDGMKTGYTNAAGWCLTATAQRDGVRIITVVMGFSDKGARNSTATRLLEGGFMGVTRTMVVAKGQRMDVPVQVANCATPTVQLVASSEVWVTVPKDLANRIELVPQQPEVIQAPAQAGTLVGEVQVKLDGRVIATSPLALTEKLDAAGWKWKMQESVRRTGQWLRRTKQVEQTG